MFTLTAFMVLSTVLLGGIWWACRNDSDTQ